VELDSGGVRDLVKGEGKQQEGQGFSMHAQELRPDPQAQQAAWFHLTRHV
jgi:hypothetical protein